MQRFQNLKNLQFFRKGGSQPPHVSIPRFVQSLGLIHPQSLSNVFEWPKLIKAFSSSVSAKKTLKKIWRSPSPFLSSPNFFFYKAWNYFVAKALQDQCKSIRAGNVICPFHIDGDEWLHSYTIFKFWAICILGDMSPQSPQKHFINCKKKIRHPPELKMQRFKKIKNLANLWGSQPSSKRPPFLCKGLT